MQKQATSIAHRTPSVPTFTTVHTNKQNGSGLDDVFDAWIRSRPLRVGRRVADPVVNTTVGRGCSKLTLRRLLSVSEAQSQS